MAVPAPPFRADRPRGGWHAAVPRGQARAAARHRGRRTARPGRPLPSEAELARPLRRHRSAPCARRSTSWWPSTCWCGARAGHLRRARTTPTASCSSSSMSSARDGLREAPQVELVSVRAHRAATSEAAAEALRPARRRRRCSRIENRLRAAGRGGGPRPADPARRAVQGPDREALSRTAGHDLPALPDRLRHHGGARAGTRACRARGPARRRACSGSRRVRR